MSGISGAGVSAELPTGWEGRVEERAAENQPGTALLQLASFALPATVGDFGGGAVQTMRSDDVFFVLFEYGPESVGTALFREHGMPRVGAREFSPRTLRFMLDGQTAVQRFFQLDGRAFCIYVVLGSHHRRFGLAPIVNRLLASIRLSR